MARKRGTPKPDSEKWLDELQRVGERPQVVPAVGVKIDCRIVIGSDFDWSCIEEVLDKCREYGAAEVVEYKTFTEAPSGAKP